MRFVEPERLNIHGMLCRFKCIASSCVDHFGCSMNALGGMLPRYTHGSNARISIYKLRRNCIVSRNNGSLC